MKVNAHKRNTGSEHTDAGQPTGEQIAGGPPGATNLSARGPSRVNPADKIQIKRHPVSLKRVVALFVPHKARIAVVVLLISGSSLISLAQPFLIRSVIDTALPAKDVPLLGLLAGAMIAVAAATALIGVVQTWLTTSMGQQIMHTLRTGLFTHLQKQSLAFFTKTRSGEVQSRLNNDISGMQSVITSTATGVASNVTTALGTAAAMIVLSPQLALLSLVVIPPAVWFSRRVALLRRDITTTLQGELATMNTYVEEGLSVSGVRLAKTLGTTARDATRYTESSQRLIGLEMRSQLAGRWRMATMGIIFSAIPALIYFTGGLPGNTMSIGTIVAFTALQATIFRPIMGLLNLGVQWVTAMALFSRIFEYLDLVPEINAPAQPIALDPALVRGEVIFEDVHFAYDGGPEVLRGITLALPAGTATAVVGFTGSGKSTLAALVPRLHDVSAGRVTIDGVDVRDIAPDVLAQIVGVVSQETYLIHASIRDNLQLAAVGADDAALWKALASAQIADLVAALPEGLDTLVGARGHRFSGGEQQRLAIARTILRNPRVLILDEATSALDNTTEAAVQIALDRLAAGRTTLIIAHRLSTVEDADQLAVLADGIMVEVGVPTELREAGGAYTALIAAGEELELAS